MASSYTTVEHGSKSSTVGTHHIYHICQQLRSFYSKEVASDPIHTVGAASLAAMRDECVVDQSLQVSSNVFSTATMSLHTPGLGGAVFSSVDFVSFNRSLFLLAIILSMLHSKDYFHVCESESNRGLEVCTWYLH